MTQQVLSPSFASLHRLVWTALLAALIAMGAYAHFPLGPVPISLQVLFVLLAGFLLGPLAGSSAVGLYLLAGLVGLPVFSGGSSGLGHILGPSGGYLLGFLLTPLVTGQARRVIHEGHLPWAWALGLAILGYVPIYGIGLPWLKASLDVGWDKALATGMLPFMVSDCLQIAAVAAASRFFHRRFGDSL